MHRFLRQSLLALTVFAAVPADADTTAVSSLGTPSFDGTVVYNAQWLADRFDTGSDTRFLKISSITIGFVSGGGTGGYFVDIYDGSATQPINLLATLSGSTNPNTAGNFTYTPTSSLTLDPSTTYWLVEGSTTSTGFYQPTYVTSPSSFSGHGWNITGTYIFSGDSGSHWAGGASNGPTQYRIGVTFVPEPQTYAMFGGILSLGTIMLLHRRRLTESA